MKLKPLTKFAAPANDEFETAFANLAFSVLQSESPMLLEYLIGFELIEKNDEETHAVGVFGFKVGKQLLFAPVFFINGQLKGNELLYIDNMDIFVPRTDGWVQYLLNRRPYILGNQEQESESSLGINQPDFSRFSESPTGGPAGYLTKYNAAKATYTPKFFSDWAKQSVGMFQWDNAKYACLTKLADFIADTAAYGTSKILAKALRKHAAFRESFVHIYDDITPFLVKRSEVDTTLHIVTDPKQPSAENVEVVEDSKGLLDSILSDSDKEKFLRREIVIKDHRTNKSTVYKADVGANLTNPTETGVYDILMQEGKFERLHVFISPRVIGPGKANIALLVSPTDGQPWGYYYTRDLWTRGRYDEDEQKLFNKGGSIEDMSIGGVYFLINDQGEVTTPFRVLRKVSNAEDESIDIWVRPYEDYSLVRYGPDGHGYCGCTPSSCRQGSRPDAFAGTEYCSFYSDISTYPTSDGYDPEKEYWYKGRRIVYRKGDISRHVRTIGKTTIVSSTFKAVRLDNEADKKIEWHNVDPGTVADLTTELMKTGCMAQLTVLNDGLNYHLSGGNEQLGPLSKKAALKHFITKWGMDQDTAQILTEMAGKQKYLVKLAISAPAIPDPSISMDSVLGVPAQMPMEVALPVQGMQPDGSGEVDIGNEDLDTMRQGAGLAQQSGQKEVFDTTVLSGLVKAVKVDSVVDKYLSDIILGLDRVGRILFMYYWHNDKFKERYGQEDLIELEDSLRNVFSGLGELVLFLKKRTVKGTVDGSAANIDLSQLL